MLQAAQEHPGPAWVEAPSRTKAVLSSQTSPQLGTLMDNKTSDSNPKNRDPISGAPGSHPIGTGIGAAAGGAAGGVAAGAATGAIAGSAAGPVGTVAGVAVGAIAGAFAGKGLAEAVNPTEEDAYWRENHNRQWYASGRAYEVYRDAYRFGYEGFGKYGTSSTNFDQHESDFRRDYESAQGSAGLRWDEAKHAAKAAWNRVAHRHERIIGYQVQDSTGANVGKVQNLWTDENGTPIFLGVKTGWIFGKNHVVPVHTAEINAARRLLKLPFTEEQIRNAPSFDETAEIEDYDQDRVFTYYGVSRHGGVPQAPQSVREEHMETPPPARTADDRTIQLKEEEVNIGKREVEAGGIRLHKVIRTEVVNQPVELKREEIVVERVPASENVPANSGFEEEDIFIPLRREEAVVQKEARVTEEVRVGKKTEVERQQVTEQVRKEDLKVDRDVDRRA